MRKRSPYTWAAIALLVIPIVVEGGRLVLNEPWPGFVAWNSHLVSVIVIATYAGSAVSLLRGPRATVAERAFAVAAPLVLTGHAVVLQTAKNRVGILYVPLALLFVFLVQRALRAERREVPRPPTREVLGGRFA